MDGRDVKASSRHRYPILEEEKPKRGSAFG
jgi:hypothetical protein